MHLAEARALDLARKLDEKTAVDADHGPIHLLHVLPHVPVVKNLVATLARVHCSEVLAPDHRHLLAPDIGAFGLERWVDSEKLARRKILHSRELAGVSHGVALVSVDGSQVKIHALQNLALDLGILEPHKNRVWRHVDAVSGAVLDETKPVKPLNDPAGVKLHANLRRSPKLFCQ